MDTKKSLDVTQGGSMVQGANAPEYSPYDSDKHSSTDLDPTKPYPTEEEWATLPKVPGRIPWTAWTVAICEFAERFSYYGTTAVCKSDPTSF